MAFHRKKFLGSKSFYKNIDTIIDEETYLAINSLVLIRCFDNGKFYVVSKVYAGKKQISLNVLNTEY